MSRLYAWKKGMPAVFIAGLLAAGLGLALPAQAASDAAAVRTAPLLHKTATIALGSTSNIFKNIFTQAPDGAVFYSRGSVVYVQKGTAAPQVALHAGGAVMALAASSSKLFVQTGLTVTAYNRSGGAKVRHWTLTSPVTPITLAGLLVVGQTLWSWTDWGTDSSGFEFARLSRINTTAAAVHVVDKQAYPVNVAANSSGVYFEDVRGAKSLGYLVHVTPSGGVHARRGPGGALLALAGGRLDQMSFHNNGHQYLDTYSTTTLRRLSSGQISDNDRMFASTGLGLIVLNEPCTHLVCAKATVSKLATNGSRSGTLTVTNAFSVLTGRDGAVVTVTHGHMSLV
ncbi:MAG: hypothetical protein ACTHKL_00020, partial [Streptosporangiaceae bacterium]